MAKQTPTRLSIWLLRVVAALERLKPGLPLVVVVITVTGQAGAALGGSCPVQLQLQAVLGTQ
jgi:hypothetical protein